MSVDKSMMDLLELLVVLANWLVVGGANQCPFPGITAHAEFGDRSISWAERRPFDVGETVRFTCPSHRWTLKGEEYTIKCQENGGWDFPLPRCGWCLKIKKNKHVTDEVARLQMNALRTTWNFDAMGLLLSSMRPA